MKKSNILLVEDDAGLREILRFQLDAAGYAVTAAEDGRAAQGLLQEDGAAYDLVLTDVRMPKMNGLELLDWVRAARPGLEVVLLSAFGDVDDAVVAMRAGAADYLTKPVKRDELEARLERVLERVALTRENRRLRARIGKGPLERLVGVSSAMVALKEMMRRIAGSNATVLITGESGTGKELVARALHDLSDRPEGPFVTVNCGAIPADLLESELFGHERGAFTGAHVRHLGRVERASGGTLFLDEIGELRPDHQVKLLRVLQEREVERVGGRAPIPVDIRLVAATHRDLGQDVQLGGFREDLYYRLAVLPLEVPPLRARAGDVRVLARHILAGLPGGTAVSMDRSLEAALDGYGWPGNVRELQNVLERMVLLRNGDVLSAADFQPKPLGQVRAVGLSPGHIEVPQEPFSLPDLEREIILKALTFNGDNRTRTAKYLGIPRHVLLYRLEKYGVLIKNDSATTRADDAVGRTGAASARPDAASSRSDGGL